jgi:hypothetical protein
MAGDAALFIDANQYLKLYGVVAGKRLLDWLDEQQVHIFVPTQIVEEVLRRKLGVAQAFFVDKLKQIGEIKDPDSLLGHPLLDISDESVASFRRTFEQAGDLTTKLTKLVSEALCKISRSEDDVSQRLKSLFSDAKSPTPDQMQRARERKERGNPPGRPKNPLGDEITWEQLLTSCKETKRLWIITDDSDFGIKHGKGKLLLLDSLLHQDILIHCAGLEYHCYDNLEVGLTDFRKKVGVTADIQTEQESSEIKKQLDDLPPFVDSLSNTVTNVMVPSSPHRGAIFTYSTGDDAWLSYAAAQEAANIPRTAIAAIDASEPPDHSN